VHLATRDNEWKFNENLVGGARLEKINWKTHKKYQFVQADAEMSLLVTDGGYFAE
jgi:hypothetical protein